MKFYSFHGYYPEEQKTGTWFSVSVAVELSDSEKVTELGDTLNYEKVHELTTQIMASPQKLIESVCYDVYSGVKKLADNGRVSVRLSKINPPLKNTAETSYEINDFS